ncbi:hypothetical protein ONV78_28990 [Hahella sp. CR1]|uniref:hypothetical protein n=1 Tax=Hahella sp. CR1 TaxID=2992807 RepID=UPI002442B0CC|nr:hypothetical protein [Hahella sp. CR1]MDG9671807.1 hypothetical protein [Hahella sp. CR1]
MRANRWFEIKHWTDITVADLPYVESPFFASSFIERSLRDDFKASDIISSLSGYYFRSTKSDIPRKGARGYKQWQEAFTKKAGLGEVLLVYKDKQKPFCSVVKETEEGLTPEGDSFALANRLIARANPAPPPPPAVTGKVSEVTQLNGNVGWASAPRENKSYQSPPPAPRSEKQEPPAQSNESESAAVNKSSQTQTLEDAAQKGTPFCEVCEGQKAAEENLFSELSSPAPAPEILHDKENVPPIFSNIINKLCKLSPTLDFNLEMLNATGWKVDLTSSQGKGTVCDRKDKKIFFDTNELSDKTAFCRNLAHETGHAMNLPGRAKSPIGISKEEFVNANLKLMLADEGEATLANMDVRAEILETDGADIGVAGSQETEYLKIYDEYCAGNITRQEAREKIGEIYADKEKPSGAKGLTYREHYGARCARFYDDYHGLS